MESTNPKTFKIKKKRLPQQYWNQSGYRGLSSDGPHIRGAVTWHFNLPWQMAIVWIVELFEHVVWARSP